MRAVIVGMALALALALPALAGGKGGGPPHSDMPVTKQVDKATAKASGGGPSLYRSTATGKHFKKATITVR
jgi:type VI protein secretion system component Hcp